MGTFMISQIDVTQNPFASENQANVSWQNIAINDKAVDESIVSLERPAVVMNDDFADETEELKNGKKYQTV